VTDQTVVTIAHEYQHMINISRRMYLLNLTSGWIDEVWLHEGLSHMAEELLFHRASGLPTRANIGLQSIVETDRAADAFNDYMLGNFFLYDAYVEEAESASPYRQSDDLATRGATWSFLRYAADRLGPTDGDLFFRLVNSGQTGLTNLLAQLNLSATDFQALERDFTVSVYADDFVSVSGAYTQPSWNMRSIYPGIGIADFRWPLSVEPLSDNKPIAAAVFAGGSASYRFSTVRSNEAFVYVTGTAGAPMPASMSLTIIRTK
jgi:hypothetical protein